jgi:hypothetical protein
VTALLHVRTASPLEGSLRVLRWVLLQLLPAWLCVVSSLASNAAAASDDDAPMCDPHGASVAAPKEVPEVDRGKLEELPCDALIRWVGVSIDLGDSDMPAVSRGSVPAPAPDVHLDRVRPEGVLPIVILSLPERAVPQRLQEPAAAGLPPREGHRNLVYRPPLFG